MANTIIKGNALMLFDSTGASYAYATSHTLSISAETSDLTVQTKDHANGIWSDAEVSKYSWEITSENLYTTNDYDKLFDSMTSGQPIDVKFGLGKSTQDTTDSKIVHWTVDGAHYEGKALITSLQANANTGENATYSLTLTGVGSITKVAAKG